MNCVWLISIFILITETLSCTFKVKEETVEDGIWDEKEFTRESSPINCECGTGPNKEKEDKPWNLYVHSKTAPTNMTTCTGTIIASNLIITSHKCLTLKDKEMNVYDMWRPKGGSRNMVDLSDVIVTNKLDENDSSGKRYAIKDIIFNAQYSYNSALQKSLPQNDILIIVLEDDLFTNNEHVPICLPQYSESLDVIGQTAVYYGAGKKGDTAPLMEIRNDLVIRGGSSDGCGKKEDDSSVHKTLCIDLMSAAPTVEGGPLIVFSDDNPPRPYLVGIATKVEEDTSIKYLEHHAERQGSTWCKIPRFELKETSSAHDDERPWESLTLIERDESLDCVCGHVNEDIGGRVVGGVEATPYEYGWMSILFTQTPGRGTSLCGGSVINDRMILTAAHCVVSDQAIRKSPNPTRQLSAPPKNIQVVLYAHLKEGDMKAVNKTVGAVLYHPGYIEPRRQNYYDYDVALLILNEPLHFPEGNGIRPVCLPKLGTTFPIHGKFATVAGWGLMNPADHYSTAKKLQKLEVPIQVLSYCSNVARTKVTERFICAGTLNNQKDAAGGDSGGPLMIDNNGQWTEVGIVSWGEDVFYGPKIGTKTAALYTDVQKVLSYVDYHAQRVRAKWCKSSPN